MKKLHIYVLIVVVFARVPYLQAQKMTPFIQAVVDGNYEVVRGWIKSGASVNGPEGPHKSTALMCAAGNGHRRIVALLLAYGARVQLKDEKGRTALDYAKKGGHKDVMQLLIAQGARALIVSILALREKCLRTVVK